MANVSYDVACNKIARNKLNCSFTNFKRKGNPFDESRLASRIFTVKGVKLKITGDKFFSNGTYNGFERVSWENTHLNRDIYWIRPGTI